MLKDRLHYFMHNPPRDDRTRLAHALDLMLPLLFFWSITISAIQITHLEQRTLNILLPLILVLETALIVTLKVRKNCHLRMHRNIWFSARKCRERIKNIDSRQDFVLLVKDLLTKTYAMKELETFFIKDESSIDLHGELGKHKIAVLCISADKDDFKVCDKQIKEFFEDIKRYHFDVGLVVTTGAFSDDAHRFVRRMKGQKKIHLFDGYTVLRMAKHAGHPIFPEEKWQKNNEYAITGLEMALSIKENILTSKKRALLFVLLGTAFLVIAALQADFIGSLYLIFGVINVFIGFSGYLLNILRRNELIFD
ncbi:restriction endonuclease [Desulfoscipio geothermicus]|uniref:Restriction endonuclease n=1 Tax=Desulfoscipio geothermicus DSM 3669 TaxID=1121426 RepID=A0A1I6DXI4_9FIRM|nr:restriction endonuclease [Desulfoscipio geothermicus]SFR10145.1 Restriction endonuclease [Desulfoscipio geothermicus DSM 3669]